MNYIINTHQCHILSVCWIHYLLSNIWNDNELDKCQNSGHTYLIFSLTGETMKILGFHCVKSVRIRSYSGPNFPTFEFSRIRIFPHSDQNNSEYGYFLRSVGRSQ